MDGIQVVQFVQRIVKDRRTQVLDLLEHNTLKSMEDYRFLMGELSSLNVVSQELSGLLEQQEHIND